MLVFFIYIFHIPLIDLIAAAFALPLIQLIHERLKFLQEETVADKSPSSIAVVSINAQYKDSSFEFSPSEQGFSCKVIESFSLSTHLIICYHDDQIKAEDPAIASSSSWFGARATHGVNSGSHYFECRVDSLSPQPTCRVGWSTIASHLELGKDEHGNRLTNATFAMINKTSNFQDSATAARASCPLQATSLSSANRTGPVMWSGVASHSTNQVTLSACMSALENALTHMRLNDEAGGSILFTKNGKLQADPIALPSREKGCVFFPAILLQGGQGGAACTVNFGGSPFHFSPPPGYSALQLSDALYSNSDREAYLTGSYRRTPLVIIFFNI